MSDRAPGLQAFIDAFADRFNIPEGFKEATEHEHSCTCEKCLNWWAVMGPDGEPDDKGAFGPFTREEVETFCKNNNMDIWWEE